MSEQDLTALNLAYLTRAYDLVKRGERDLAGVLLGVTEALADWLEGATLEAVMALARSGLLVYQPRVPEQVLRDAPRTLAVRELFEAHAYLGTVRGRGTPA